MLIDRKISDFRNATRRSREVGEPRFEKRGGTTTRVALAASVRVEKFLELVSIAIICMNFIQVLRVNIKNDS
jgi:hypothetical protein